MKAPLTLGWVSGKQPNPFAVIADATGSVVAKALGLTGEEAEKNAVTIIRAINREASA